MSFTCTKEFQITVPAGDPKDTATIITAVKSHYAITLNHVLIGADCRCTAATTDVTGTVFYYEGLAILGNGAVGTYGVAGGFDAGIVGVSKIVHGTLFGTGGYHNSTSADLELLGTGNWPNTVNIDAAALAAFQALKPTVAGLLTMVITGTFDYHDASLSLSLYGGSSFLFQWPGNQALYKRHDNSLVPTGVFYFYQGTANPIAQVTIS